MDKRAQSIKFLKFLTMLTDMLIVCASFYMAVFIKNLTVTIPTAGINSIQTSLPYMCLSTVVLLYVYGLYSILSKSVFEIFLSIGIIVVINMVITMALTFFLREFAFPRSTIFISGMVQFFLLSAFRYAELVLRRKLHGKQTLLVVGKDYEVRAVTNKILLSSGHLYRVKFFIEIQDNMKIIRKLMKQVDHVVICSNVSEKDRAAIFSLSMELKVNVFFIPNLFNISMRNSILYQFDDIPTFIIKKLSLTDEQRFVKRLFDIVISMLALIIASPFMLLIALAVKLTSPGPVIYKQERVTKGRKRYEIYKFRTMVDNAEEQTGPVLAADHDPRLTKIGDFLRMARLDELPQFFNVLIGDMSIVGPRPERMFFIEQIKRDLPDIEYRFSVKAGITGLAQVMGKYSTNLADKLIYDLIYIRNYSVLMDMQIMMQTVKIALTRGKSRGVVNGEGLDETLSGLNYRVQNGKGYYEIIRACSHNGSQEGRLGQ